MRRAASATVVVIGPETSCRGDSGMMPAVLVRPIVGRKPTSDWCAAGPRMDPHESVPRPAGAYEAATAAAVPPLDPLALHDRSYGFAVRPRAEPSVYVPCHANSDMFVLARMIAPAARSRATAVESAVVR